MILSTFMGRKFCARHIFHTRNLGKITVHCLKHRNFTLFRGAEILGKHTVSVEFRAIRPKLCGNCAFQENSHTKEIG